MTMHLCKTEYGLLTILEKFVRKVRQALKAAGYDEEKYAGHSFRIGKATTAAAAGIEDYLIKSLGRWQKYHICQNS